MWRGQMNEVVRYPLTGKAELLFGVKAHQIHFNLDNRTSVTKVKVSLGRERWQETAKSCT